METEKIATNRQAVADAAVRCFQRFGVHRASMTDVADEAGMSRQSVYRLFPSRPGLLEFIVGQRIAAMGESLRPYFAGVETLEEALVEGSMLSVQLGTEDQLFAEIVNQSGEHKLEQFLFRGSKEIQKMMLALWAPVLNKARADGKLRPGVTNEQAVAWIRNQHAVLMIREDDEATRRRHLETFVVPSLVRDKAG
jgi:AcrR family transcriptional regulator